MTATITTVKLTMTERSEQSISRRKTRLEATRVRMKRRRDRSKSAIERTEQAIAKLQAKLVTQKAKLDDVEEYAANLIRKQEEELKTAVDFHATVVAREAKKAQAPAKKTKVPPGTVHDEDGKLHELKKEDVDAIKSVIGKRRKGVLSPLDGSEAQLIIDAIACSLGQRKDNMGDIFQVAFKGRKTAILFSVEVAGLAFMTVPGTK